jgi:hypothetical protein
MRAFYRSLHLPGFGRNDAKPKTRTDSAAQRQRIFMREDITNEDLFKPLGEARWRELAEATGASELQLRFAAARFGGANATAAAKIAGYKGGTESIRRAGYSALRSSAVQNLLELASVHAPADPRISQREVIAKISKLCRSSDPLVALKAVAALADYEKAEKAAGAAPEDDGFAEWRVCRDYLMIENGASQFMLWYRARNGNLGVPSNYPLLLDVHALMKGEPFGQQIWDWACGPGPRDDLDKLLANKNWQIEARRKIWAEIGIRLESNGSFSREAAHAT